ncbi:MAG TPA: AAA family ATPase [Myxococcota bacterium]|nr:AAA family ATPase [Myxococcota bacterium]
MPDAPLRIRRMILEGLFGSNSPRIDIPLHLDERVTVLHGRNGSGKTITLQLLQALRAGRYDALLRYPLTRVSLETTDGAALEIERDPSISPSTRRGAKVPSGLRYTIRSADGETRAGEIAISPLKLRPSPGLRHLLTSADLTPQGEDTWFDPRRGRLLTTAEAAAIYGFPHDDRPRSEEPADLVELRARLPPIKLIRTDRLYVRAEEWEPGDDPRRRHPSDGSPRLMVEHLSDRIRALVQQADREYRLTSTRLDASLPQRLFDRQASSPSPDELNARGEDIQGDEARLRDLGLLRDPPTTTVDQATLSEADRRTLSIILRDREEKLAPFKPVADKAERLLTSLRGKLHPKRVLLDVETGYRVLTAEGAPLELGQLSSGEQHEMVLLHELLFDVTPGSLILIDEPELSLHVTWQQDLLPELMEIARLASLDFVLATHSGYIIGDHEELMVRLGEPT